MLEILANIFRPNPPSAKTAKERLVKVVIQERLKVSESQLNNLKHDLYQVISKYFDISQDSLELEIQDKNGHPALTVNTEVKPTS
ncbi:MAG: cell division topological specificity factor MinE [SAR324 cluster bacterium]|nr:cell division topological specificity factor MinE [SAR324 cluster bacterium]